MASPPEHADKMMQTYRELRGDREAIFWLFNDRCVDCKQKAEEVNEIVPRARSKHATEDWRNQVTLCHFCHVEFHRNGVTDDKIARLIEKRKEFLIAMGREDYV